MIATSPPEAGAGTGARQVFTVSELAETLRGLLETSLPGVWIQGELSNFRNPTGHWYFTLKDASAQIRCAMFKSANFYVRPQPKDGDLVLVRGKVDFYTARGELQIVVDHLEPAGTGALLRAFEELKRKLAAEGLFDEQLKRPLPRAPRHIGVVTSSTGAAFQDILTTLRRRYPLGTVHLFPVPVQGDTAPPAIVEALRALPRLAPVDVVILARGGGSIEDLWAFNDERVARAIRACAVPVVCGVGHEIDFTIADFAADLRAPTPTAAAELASPDAGEWREQLNVVARRLAELQRQALRGAAEAVTRLGARLDVTHPGRRLTQQMQRLDELQERLGLARRRAHERPAQRVDELGRRLLASHPAARLPLEHRLLDQRATQLRTRVLELLHRAQTRHQRSDGLLRSLSPQAILERGYAVARRADGAVLRDAAALVAGDGIEVVLARGGVQAEVRRVMPAESLDGVVPRD